MTSVQTSSRLVRCRQTPPPPMIFRPRRFLAKSNIWYFKTQYFLIISTRVADIVYVDIFPLIYSFAWLHADTPPPMILTTQPPFWKNGGVQSWQAGAEPNVVSYLSNSAHFFLMFPTAVSPIPKCRATKKEDLPLFNIRINNSLF